MDRVRGGEGNFSVRVIQHPRFVRLDKCIACGLCAEKCPRKVENEYDARLGQRKAIYLKYPQTIPQQYAIDAKNCIYFQTGKCRACEKFCPAGAIHFTDQAKEKDLQVGAIILAPGFEAFDPSGHDIFGYGRYPNIVTSLELERILSASGPFMGHLVRLSDRKVPRRIAFLQCVGSRDLNRGDNGYCSSICCMAAIKEALVAQEHTKDPLDLTVFYIDLRSYGKDFEKYYHRAQDRGIRFVRCRVHSVYCQPGKGDPSIRYLDEKGRIQEENFDLVVLSTGLRISDYTRRIAQRLEISLDKYSFAQTSSFEPVNTNLPGIYVGGCFQGPKDIPSSVMEASAAAGAAAAHLSPSRGSLTREETFPEERDVSPEKPRIGVIVCNCGTNIGGVVRVPEVVEYAQTLPEVIYARENLFSCSQDAQEQLKEVIQKKKLNRVIIAACSPRTHESLFQETLRGSGLNKYLLEMANIRDQCSWVHQDEVEAATEKAKDLVRLAVAKARLARPLKENEFPVHPSALIVGGGIAGMTAALNLAHQGFRVHIVEKENVLGGQARKIRETWRGEDVQSYLEKLTAEVRSESKIKIHLHSEVAGVKGFVGNFQTTLTTEDLIDHGVTLLATGANPLPPEEYLYGQHPGVTLWHELDDLLDEHPDRATQWKCAVFILCTGSRTPQRPYCSKICCTSTIHRALGLKKRNPEMEVFVLYRDIRTYGTREDLYLEARKNGVLFLRYDLENKPRVEGINGRLQVTVMDPILGRPIRIEPDIINLASAIIPPHQEKLAGMYKVPLNQENFFVEAHMKLRPVDFAAEGVFLCGMAHYPKPIDESITQALAAASRAATVLSRRSILTSGIVAVINPDNCIGCRSCLHVCPYEAIEYDDLHHVCKVNGALCKGCGACSATCPSASVQLMGYRSDQLYAMIHQTLTA